MITDLDDQIMVSAIQPITPTFSLPFFCYRCNLTKRAASLAAYRTPSITVMLCAPCARTLTSRKERAEKKAKKRGRRETTEVVDSRVVVPELLDVEAQLATALADAANQERPTPLVPPAVVVPLVSEVTEKIVRVRNPRETADHAATVATSCLTALGLQQLVSHGWSTTNEPPAVRARREAGQALVAACRRLRPHLGPAHPALCYFDQMALVSERANDWRHWTRVGTDEYETVELAKQNSTKGGAADEADEDSGSLAVRRLRLLLDFDDGALVKDVAAALQRLLDHDSRLRSTPLSSQPSSSPFGTQQCKDDTFALVVALLRRGVSVSSSFLFLSDKQRARLSTVAKQVAAGDK